MTARTLVLAGAGAAATAILAAAALAATPPPAKKPNPCKGIKNCITVNGPWVAVPGSGAATFLLECPKRNGYVGGIDALTSSDDVRMSWEARMPQPINTPLAKTTNSLSGPYAFFTGISAAGKRGFMQPWIGCVPTPPTNPRVTVSARAASAALPGKPVDRWQKTVMVHAGHQTATRACGKGERLLGGWQAIAFKADAFPNAALQGKVHPTLATGDGQMVVSVKTDPGIPDSAFPEVQVGALCAK
jgi:hypothetical protein